LKKPRLKLKQQKKPKKELILRPNNKRKSLRKIMLMIKRWRKKKRSSLSRIRRKVKKKRLIRLLSKNFLMPKKMARIKKPKILNFNCLRAKKKLTSTLINSNFSSLNLT